MPKILNIETATDVCSVALSDTDGIVSVHHDDRGRTHASVLTILIEKCIHEAGLGMNQLDAVAVSMGPGSYTGLRIGVSAAKGISYALGIPLIPVPTLKAMAAVRLENSGRSGRLLVPMIDARRMEVYMSVIDEDLNVVSETDAVILQHETFSEFTGKGSEVLLFGDAVPKARKLYDGVPGIHFDEKSLASSAGVASLSKQLYESQAFADTAYFEPYYLKDFVRTGRPGQDERP